MARPEGIDPPTFCLEVAGVLLSKLAGASAKQQVVNNADQLLAPSLSHLSSRFATICHNYYYVFMTVERLAWARTIRLQQLHQLLLFLCVFSN